MSADRTRSTAPSPIAFAGATLDRAAHLRDDIDRLRERDTSRAVLVSHDQGISITEGRTLSLLPVAALPADVPLTFLGLDPSGAAMFGFDTLHHGAPDHQTFASLRTLAAELDPAEAGLAAYAVGMVNWHRVTEYCGRSGHATEVEAGGHRRRCPGCGLLQFPRTDPAVTMLVQNGDRCLLSRRHGAPANRWSALAGFLEPGETPEEAVVREAREETRVEVTRVQYVASQPWPFPAALMIGFWAFVDGDDDGADGAPKPQADELVEARWWDRRELATALADSRVDLPPAGTIGNFLISTWLTSAPRDT